jgi:hypothetical protein
MRARLGSRMHGIHLLIRSLRPLVRPVLARPGPRVPVLVKGIALVVESSEIRRHPDSRAT